MEILLNFSHSYSSKRNALFDRARVSAITIKLKHYTVLLIDVFQLKALLDARAALHDPDLPGKNGVAITHSSRTPRSTSQICRVKKGGSIHTVGKQSIGKKFIKGPKLY